MAMRFGRRYSIVRKRQLAMGGPNVPELLRRSLVDEKERQVGIEWRKKCNSGTRRTVRMARIITQMQPDYGVKSDED